VRNRKIDGGESNQDRWLLTYADMITLLLALFIVMYAMSKIDEEKFSNVTQALATQLKGGETIFEKSLSSDVVQAKLMNMRKLRLLEQKIQSRIKIANMRDTRSIGISTLVDERGLVIHVEESALFESGDDKLKQEAYEPLDLVCEQIKGIPNSIRIEGHTDNRPIKTARFPSNWELSAFRAITVVRYFIDKHEISPTKLSALGFGEFRPLSDNVTAEGRAKNRRVDIVVLSQSEESKDPHALKIDQVVIHEDPLSQE
jgi:chemotaxis protein MotB